MSTISRIAKIAMAAVALAGGTALMAPPAQAGSWSCYGTWDHRNIALPGKPDIDVSARSCVYKDGNTRRARIQLRWEPNLEGLGGDRFDKFSVQVRLEQNDKVIASNWCDLRGALNGDGGSDDCSTSYVASSYQYGWTGDGKIVYNINNDGLGDYVWNLHGSNEVKIAPNGLEVGDEPEPEPLPDPADTPQPAQ
jgi:hypothetical protein